ncbi:MAG: Smr/MutS family protein [Spirochaetales bacterium]
MNDKIIKIDIKENMPPVDVAMFLLEREIELAKLSGVRVIKVIHGYGSSGKGGDIKKAVRAYLKEAKRKGHIVNYVGGEGWSVYKVKELGLLEDAPELLLNSDGESFNLGMTLVIL